MKEHLMSTDSIAQTALATQPADEDERAAFTRGLREVADWLDVHPEVKLPYLGAHVPGSSLPALPIWVHAPYAWDEDQSDVRSKMATIVRAMGTANKSPGLTDDTFIVWRQFGGLAVYASTQRDEVCERVVTGTREVVEEVPDPEALAAVPTVTVTKVVEDVEWRCMPLLDGAGPGGAA